MSPPSTGRVATTALETAIGALSTGTVHNATPVKPRMDNAKPNFSFLIMIPSLPSLEVAEVPVGKASMTISCGLSGRHPSNFRVDGAAPIAKLPWVNFQALSGPVLRRIQ
jgi:hypothetical protein